MTTYYLGQPFTETLTVREKPTIPGVPGVLVDPTTIGISFRYPSGVVTPGPAVTRDSLGQFHADVTLPAVGKYRRVWTTTGPGAGVAVEDHVIVDPLAPEIVSLADIKDHLNIDRENTTFDGELSDHIAALPPVVENLAGPVLPVQYTETLTGGRSFLVVRHPPIASVAAMASWGALVVTDFEVDKKAGLIRYPEALYSPNVFPFPVTVTYTSGYIDVPEAIGLAARIIVEHWWESQRAKAAGGRADRRDPGDTIDVPGLGFAIPRYAAELLQPFNPGTGLH